MCWRTTSSPSMPGGIRTFVAIELQGLIEMDFDLALTWAMKGWHQIFFHDPEGNVIEVHQIMSE